METDGKLFAPQRPKLQRPYYRLAGESVSCCQRDRSEQTKAESVDVVMNADRTLSHWRRKWDVSGCYTTYTMKLAVFFKTQLNMGDKLLSHC